MPHLIALAEAGFAIWPFEGAHLPRAVEVYPRVLTAGSVRKSNWEARREYLFRHFGEQPVALLERAAGSDDAFDAAVSALTMARHGEELASLSPSSDPDYAIEGRIWEPGAP